MNMKNPLVRAAPLLVGLAVLGLALTPTASANHGSVSGGECEGYNHFVQLNCNYHGWTCRVYLGVGVQVCLRSDAPPL